MQLEILVKTPHFHKKVELAESAIKKLLNTVPHKPNTALRYLTNSSNLSKAQTYTQLGKYIHAIFYDITNPQEAYRNLSNAGFILVDSRITL